MAPNGEMYFNKDYFREDFSASFPRNRHWFIHEMVHVLQHQLGYPVKWRGTIRLGVGYEYTLAADKRLSDYNMEAHGDIVEDYFARTELNDPSVIKQKSNRDPGLIPLYRTVLADFLANPVG